MDTARGVVAAARRRLRSSASGQALVDQRRAQRRPKLIFVLGSQRSGTNVLRQSLSLDPDVQGYNEQARSRLYEKWMLRPEAEIRTFLVSRPGTVLVKPIKSVIDRPVADLIAEFADYPLKVAWIYRDPAAVFRSAAQRWSYKSDIGRFIAEWNRVNASVLRADDPRIAVANYDALADDPRVFIRLCAFLGVRGENLFRPAPPAPDLPAEVISRIRAQTAEIMQELASAASQIGADHVAKAQPTLSETVGDP